MKTKDEIQRAHDLICPLILGQTPITISDEMRQHLTDSASVLCWILEHDHNPTFDQNLKAVEMALASSGFVLENKGN